MWQATEQGRGRLIKTKYGKKRKDWVRCALRSWGLSQKTKWLHRNVSKSSTNARVQVHVCADN